MLPHLEVVMHSDAVNPHVATVVREDSQSCRVGSGYEESLEELLIRELVTGTGGLSFLPQKSLPHRALVRFLTSSVAP